MIYWVRSASISDGKQTEAWEHAVKAATYLREHYPEMNFEGDLEVLSHISGLINRVTWVARIESLAVVEGVNKKFSEDSDWLKLNAKGEGLFISSSFEDHFYTKIL
jgi:hypothetical protein